MHITNTFHLNNKSGTAASCGATVMMVLNKGVSYELESISDKKLKF